MKYLENSELEEISHMLSGKEIGGGLIVYGRVEAYSIKKTTEEKKMSKQLTNTLPSPEELEQSSNHNMIPINSPQPSTSYPNSSSLSTSPPVFLSSSSSNSYILSNNNHQLDEKEKNSLEFVKDKKILINLIQLLSLTESDYDFSDLTYQSFVKLNSINEAMTLINNHLIEINLIYNNFLSNMWTSIDKALCNKLSSCEIFLLNNKEVIEEMNNEEKLSWYLYIFFYNVELKRVVYFRCNAINKFKKRSCSMYDSEDMDEDEYFMMDEDENEDNELMRRDDDDEDDDEDAKYDMI